MTLPQKKPSDTEAIESVIAEGDLSKLTPEQRMIYYNNTCKSLGLNPLTQPFEYIKLQGKLRLYARRDAADQLRKLHNINIEVVSQDIADGLLIVHVRATSRGRQDEDLGVVPFPATLAGEARANTVMKAVTKAKRRVTLSICGLGFLDETEVDTIPGARIAPTPAPNVLLHDPETGEIKEPAAVEAALPQTAVAAPVSVSQPDAPEAGAVLPLEDMAREAARRGDIVFAEFYRNRTGAERKRINAIGDELRELINEAEKEAKDDDSTGAGNAERDQGADATTAGGRTPKRRTPGGART